MKTLRKKGSGECNRIIYPSPAISIRGRLTMIISPTRKTVSQKLSYYCVHLVSITNSNNNTLYFMKDLRLRVNIRL